MELNVLIVEDDLTKLGRLNESLLAEGIDQSRVTHTMNSAAAYAALEEQRFDLMLLDVNLPRRLGERPKRGGGLDLLREMTRSATLQRPRYIVGVTAFADVVSEFGEQFTEQLWTLIHYEETSDLWMRQIASKLEYIRSVRESDNFTDGKTFGVDLGVVCALETVELQAVRGLPCEWQPLRLPHDETRYLSGSIEARGRTFSVVAAAAPRMGMPASAVLASKMITSFRPRYLAIVGICAGRVNKVELGDVVVADPTWDWGSGKIDSVNDQPRFQPFPHQIELDIDLLGLLKESCADAAFMASVKDKVPRPHPRTELRAHFGPLASGAAVIADKATFDSLLDQHRGLLAIEMEAYAVAMACKGMGKPRPTPIIMKSVCDFADRDKDDDWQNYAAGTSAWLLYETAQKFL